jgi:hypothetical protein
MPSGHASPAEQAPSASDQLKSHDLPCHQATGLIRDLPASEISRTRWMWFRASILAYRIAEWESTKEEIVSNGSIGLEVIGRSSTVVSWRTSPLQRGVVRSLRMV